MYTIMKKFFFAVIIMSLSFNILAQVDHDYNPNDVVPATGTALTNDQVPASVLKAMKVDFALDDPQTWTKFPYALKEYGFVYDKAATDVKPDRYEVKMKTKDGAELFAVYSKDGTLIATREVFLNSTMPADVKAKLANSIYSDWAVIGTKEIIKYYYDKNSVDQHYRVTVAKDNVTRTLSFNFKADAADNTSKK
jgi:hypothetical protein